MEGLDDAAGPGEFNGGFNGVFAEAEMDRTKTGGGVANAGGLVVVLFAGCGHHHDARANVVPIALDALEGDVEPMVGAWAAVHPELGVEVERGDNGIDAPVA